MSILLSKNKLKDFRNLNPKRKAASKKGIDSWYPYYAGYTRVFAEEVLKSLTFDSNCTLLDPWNGSGTTTFVGDNFGLNTIGVDINPVAVLVASAKLVRSSDAHHYRGVIEEIISLADNDQTEICVNNDALVEWISPTALRYFRKLQKNLIRLLATDRNGHPVNPINGSLPPFASFLMLALVKAARSLSSTKKSTNPTWVRPDTLPKIYTSQLKSEFLKSADLLCQDIALEDSSNGLTRTNVILGDARELDFIKSASIDAILTSPPYCTRIDYAINTSFELAALGVAENDVKFRHLRENLTGTTLIRSESDDPKNNSIKIPVVKKLLSKIENHNSVASSTYYLKNYKQYFEDMYMSMSELGRVLKPNSPAIMVVQNSYYKEIEIDLATLLISIGKEFNFKGRAVKDIEVSSVLSSINPLSKKYHPNRKYYESIIILEKQ